jgi:hypothetical protein
MLARLVFTLIAVLFASGGAHAEEVGTTPDGNVIYRFRCPHPSGDAKVHWEKHIGDHPVWDYEGGSGGALPHISAFIESISGSGQVLTCRYSVTLGGEPIGHIHYGYTVHRHIISCERTETGAMKCVLGAGGGGQSSSKIESSPAPPTKCVGLGCETQPNPGGCIGMGCGDKQINKDQPPESP